MSRATPRAAAALAILLLATPALADCAANAPPEVRIKDCGVAISAIGKSGGETLLVPLKLRADAYLEKGEVKLAIADLEQITAIDPKNAAAHRKLAEAFTLWGEKEAAAEQLAKAKDLEAAAGAPPMASAPRLTSDPEKFATAKLKESIALPPVAQWTPPADDCPGGSRDRLGRCPPLNPMPPNPVPAVVLGDDLDELIADCKQVTAPDRRLEACNNLIERTAEIGRLRLADALANRADEYRARKRHSAALKDIDRAIELDHEFAYAFAQRGSILRETGKLKDALADLELAIELDPGDAIALAERGAVYRQKGDLVRALRDLDEAIELNGSNPMALAERGAVYREKGDLEQALADLDRAIQLRDDDPFAYEERSKVHKRLGNRERSKADFAKAKELRGE